MITTTTQLTNFDLYFGWMMDKLHGMYEDLDWCDMTDDPDDPWPIDPSDALAHVTERFEDVEEVLCHQAYLEDQVGEGWWDPDYCLGEED